MIDFVQWGEDHAPRASTPGGRLHAILLIEYSTAVGSSGSSLSSGATRLRAGTSLWRGSPSRGGARACCRGADCDGARLMARSPFEKPISEAMADFLSKQDTCAAPTSSNGLV